MSEEPNGSEHHGHAQGRFSICGGLFGCGEDTGRRYQVEAEATQAALERRTMDRFDHWRSASASRRLSISNQGVHAMIPKNIFAAGLRDSIKAV